MKAQANTVDKAELKQLDSVATPGPWTVPHFADDGTSCDGGSVLSGSQRGMGAIATVHWEGEGGKFARENEDAATARANARFIALSRSAVPELLAENERLREALEVVQEHAANLWDVCEDTQYRRGLLGMLHATARALEEEAS